MTVVPNLERAFNLDAHIICVFLSKDGECRTADTVLAGRGFLPTPE